MVEVRQSPREKPDPSKESQKEINKDTQPSNDSQESSPEEVPTAQDLLNAKDHLSAGREVAEVALRKIFLYIPRTRHTLKHCIDMRKHPSTERNIKKRPLVFKMCST